jgi:hypothetical protein
MIVKYDMLALPINIRRMRDKARVGEAIFFRTVPVRWSLPAFLPLPEWSDETIWFDSLIHLNFNISARARDELILDLFIIMPALAV